MAGLETWPAFHEEWYGHWVFRSAGGMTRRNNSVTPMGEPLTDLDVAIDWAEAWFDDHGIPPIFRLTELAPPNLRKRLSERTYERTDTTLVMTRSTEVGHFDPNVLVSEEPTREWRDLLVADRPLASEFRASFDELLALAGLPSGFAELVVGGTTRAIGQVTMSASFAVIFNMKTDPAHRRSGYAARTLATLLAHASARGAKETMLQVQDDNHPAISLYSQAGFTTRYEYCYYQRPRLG